MNVIYMILGDSNPDHREYTWSKRTPFVAGRLDYILTNSGIFDKTIDCHIVSVPMSDHRRCLIHIKFMEVVKGNGYWKFYNSLLCDIEFVTQMNMLIDSFLRENELDYQMLWELLKVKIKELSIHYSKRKSIELK